MASMLPTWSLSTNDSVAPRATSTTLPTAPAKQQQLRTRRFGNATASSSTPVSRSKHVHFAWRSVQDVNYLRACADNAATGTVTVYHCVNGTSELWQTHLLLKTDGALAALRRPERNGTRCLRYENRGCCADGPRCAYIHVITLDPSLTTEAKRRVRPNQQQLPPTSTTAQQPPNEQPLQRTSLPQWQSCVKKSALTPFGGRADDSDDDDEDDYFMATVDESSRPITVERSQTHLDVPSFSACVAPSERSVALCTVSRTTVWWRHDPYSSEATRVQCCTPANA